MSFAAESEFAEMFVPSVARTKVKEEEVEDSPMLDTPVEAPKTTRGRKAAAAATKAPASSRSTGRSKAGASAKKAVAEDASEQSGDKGKENTPEEEVAPLPKTRSTRKTTKRAATEEREENPVETGKARVSRSKTGSRR